MSVSSIGNMIWNGITLSANSAAAVGGLTTAWSSLVGSTGESTKALTFASTITTIKGVGWNCVFVPIQAGGSAVFNYVLVQKALNSFIQPEGSSPKALAIDAIAWVSSSVVGYHIAQSLNYEETPHLNPGFDPRWISLASGIAGATLIHLHLALEQKKKAQVQQQESTIVKLFHRYIY